MGGLNADTALLLHCDGADGSTVVEDVSTSNNKGNADTYGTVQLDTTYKKWGSASLMFDGDSDYVAWDDDLDFEMLADNTQDYTADCWVRFANDGSQSDEVVFCTGDNNNNFFSLFNRVGAGKGLRFIAYEAGAVIIDTGFWFPGVTDSDWHHLALCKVTSAGPTVEWGVYLDGNQVLYVSDNSTVNYSNANFFLGARPASSMPGDPLEGHIDEFRLQKSNIFSATPVVGTSDTISLPTGPYGSGDGVSRRVMLIT